MRTRPSRDRLLDAGGILLQIHYSAKDMNSSVMELKIKLMGGEERSLGVRGDATVGELKQLISEVFGEPPHKQKLSAENGSPISSDSTKLSDHGLQSGSLVILLNTNKPFQVLVKNLVGITKTYDVDVNETVDQLQTKIHNKEGITQDQQRLICNGKHLEPGKKLQDYNIKPEDIIYLVLRVRGGNQHDQGV